MIRGVLAGMRGGKRRGAGARNADWKLVDRGGKPKWTKTYRVGGGGGLGYKTNPTIRTPATHYIYIIQYNGDIIQYNKQYNHKQANKTNK